MIKQNKKIGGAERAKKARQELIILLQDEKSQLYFAKDIELAKKYDISRHTMYKIREEYEIPSRLFRILNVLKSIDLSKYTIKDLSEKFNIKYQNLYRIIKDNNLKVKPDTPPIESLKRYQKSKKVL